jgi:hypothetical protein
MDADAGADLLQGDVGLERRGQSSQDKIQKNN